MENLNVHKQKLFAVIIAAIGIIACILPWWSVGGGTAYGYRIPSVNINGLHKLGIIAFIAFIAAGIVPFVMGDKTKPFEGQVKMITAGCFGAAALFILLTLLFNMKYLAFGIFLAMVVAVIGALFVWGLVKMPQTPSSPTPPKA